MQIPKTNGPIRTQQQFNDGLTHHKPTPRTTQDQRLTGFCSSGHLFRFHGFIDSEGTWRCRICRSEKNAERKYWRLVKRYMNGDAQALEILEREYWQTP